MAQHAPRGVLRVRFLDPELLRLSKTTCDYMDFQKASFPETRQKPGRKARFTEMNFI